MASYRHGELAAERSFLRHPSLPGVEVAIVRGNSRRSGSIPQVSAGLRLALVLAGARNRFRYRGTSWETPQGSVVFAEPGEVHAPEPDAEQYEVAVLDVATATFAGLAHEGELGVRRRGGFPRKSPLSTDPQLCSSIRRLLPVLGDAAADRALLWECMHEFVDAFSSAYLSREKSSDDTGGEKTGVRRAREMLQGSYQEAITLDQLAAVSRLPRSRFLREFKREIGLAPHAYQLNLRVQHARQLIAAGAALSEAAVAVGFCDQSHLHRHFSRIVGVTPGSYRRRASACRGIG